MNIRPLHDRKTQYSAYSTVLKAGTEARIREAETTWHRE